MRSIAIVEFAALLLTFSVSEAATLPMTQTTVEIYRVPVGNTLVMTQACIEGDGTGFGPSIVGSELGPVPGGAAGAGGLPSEACTNYSLGVVFQGGETISCSAGEFGSATDSVCLINGVLQ